MTTRISLMMMAEQLLENHPAALDPAVDALIDVLSVDDTPLRGDTADLLGRIGNPAAVEPLKKLLTDPDADVAEVAQDSLDAIEEQGRTV
jgi:HEAT repeat protein